MALVTQRCVFLHLPKTGGTWIRRVFRACKIPHCELSDYHARFPRLLNYQSEEFFRERLILVFVRHPLTWYQSYWTFRIKYGWDVQHPLDINCISNDFHTFIENVLRYRPDGWLSWLYKSYYDTIPDFCNRFIGRLENLIEDMIEALRLAGETYNEKVVRSVPRTNDSDMDGKPSRCWAPYSRSLAERVLAVEQDVIRRYYSDYTIDVDALCGPRPY